MSRKRRHQREIWRSPQGSRSFQEPAARVKPRGSRALRVGNKEGEGRLMYLVEFDITFEPMDDPQLDLLSPEDLAELDSHRNVLEAIVYREPLDNAAVAAYIAMLRRLYAIYPKVAKLNNYLAAACQAMGQYEELPALIREGYRNCPDNLFAVASYAGQLMTEGRLDEAGEVFEGRMSIAAMAPKRKLFHFSEVIAYQGVVGLYLALSGETHAARVCLEMIEGLDEEHPLVVQLREALSPSNAVLCEMITLVGKLRERLRRPRKRAMVESR